MEITLNLWQVLGAVVPIATFLGWAARHLIILGKTWEGVTQTLTEMSTHIADIKNNEGQLNEKMTRMEGQLNDRMTRNEAQMANFITRMEMLETLKRIELFALTLVPQQPPLDLTTPIAQGQQREFDRFRDKAT